MPTPKEVFDNPLQHRDFLQSVDFEMSYCCPYNPNELDMGVVEVFKEAFLERRGVESTSSEQGSVKKALRSIDERLARIQ